MRASTLRVPYLSKAQRMFLFGLVGTSAVLGGAALVATSCLDRGRSTQGTSTTTITSGEMRAGSTVNDSTGGTRALSTATEAAPPGGAPLPTSTSMYNASSAPSPSIGTTEAPPPAGHADHQSYDPNSRSTPMPASQMTAPASTETPPPPPASSDATDGGTSSVTPPANGAATAPASSSSAMSRGQSVTGANTPTVPGETRSPSFSAGAGKFITEAPPDRASSWTSNPEAGAGPFTTDRSTPPEPIWYGAPSGSRAPR